MITYVSFIYLIPEDVLPGDSKAIGIICTLLINLSYPELYSPDDDDDGEELAWGRGKTRTFLFS